MPIAIRVDQPTAERADRADAYGGTINLTGPTASSLALITFAKELIGEGFGGRDPEFAQFDLPVGEYAAIVDALEHRFADHPESTRLLQRVLVDRGCDPATTYFGLPRLTITTSDDYLGTGTAYAWDPFRDTWRSAPLAQLNHWMSVFQVGEDNAKALHPEYFHRAVGNDSGDYDHRGKAAGPLPGLTEGIDLLAATVLVPAVGGILQFSGQHLHSDVPNTSGRTRFSLDFHTIDVTDVRANLGARNVDGRCTGSSIRDFVSAADLSPAPADVVALLDDDSAFDGMDDLVHVAPVRTETTRA